MPQDAREVANFFLDRAKATPLQLTHLSLQKILFFAHAWHLAKYNSPLVGQRFEAWQYGPVIRVIYDQLKSLGSRPISRKLEKINTTSGFLEEASYQFDAEQEIFMSNIFDYYAKFDAGRLVDLTHEPGGPWEKVWKTGASGAVVGMYIPDESIRVWILREGGSAGIARN